MSDDWPGSEGGREGERKGREGGREGGKEVEEAVQALVCACTARIRMRNKSPPIHACISSRYPMPTQEASTTHIYIKS